MYLDVKKQEVKYDFFIWREKCNKQGESIAFSRWKSQGKVHVRNLEILERWKRLNVI